MEKIIIVTKTKDKGGFQARLFGKNPPVQTFAKTELDALRQLIEKLEKRNKKFIR